MRRSGNHESVRRAGARSIAAAVLGALAIWSPLSCKCRGTPAPAPISVAPIPAPPAAVAEREPNDAQHPQAIPARAVVTGLVDVASGEDHDWYRVEAGQGATLAVKLRLSVQAPYPAKVSLEAYDRDKNLLVAQVAQPGVATEVPAVACRDACFVVVSGRLRATYQLEVDGEPPAPGVELEPNDRPVDAQPLKPGDAVHGSLSGPADLDFYRVELPPGAPPGAALQVTLTGPPEVPIALELHALADGALLGELHASAGETLVAPALPLAPPPLPPAPFAVAAALSRELDGGTGSNSTPPAQGGQVDGGEPEGDLPDQASPAAPDPDDEGDDEADDELPDGGSIAEPQAPAPSAPVPVPAAAAAGPDAGVVVAPPAAPAPMGPQGFFLVVRARSWPKAAAGVGAARAYELKTALVAVPPDFEREPNDVPASASELTQVPVAAGAASAFTLTSAGFIAPAGDVDWFRVRSTGPSVARVELSGVERTPLALQVLTLDAKGKPVVLARTAQAGPRETSLLPAVGLPGGDAFVGISAAPRSIEGRLSLDGSDASTPYHLTLTLAGDDGTREREPNDDPRRAQLVNLPVRLTGYLFPKGDVDLFQFHVDAGHPPVTLRVSAVRGVDLMLTLLELKPNRKPQVIGTSDRVKGEGAEQLVAVPLAAGDYLVKLHSPRGDASATQGYELVIR